MRVLTRYEIYFYLRDKRYVQIERYVMLNHDAAYKPKEPKPLNQCDWSSQFLNSVYHWCGDGDVSNNIFPASGIGVVNLKTLKCYVCGTVAPKSILAALKLQQLDI